ncbi:MAG TPA: cytochrome P450 [Pseudonocardiaceae bacterium]|nr:cytochrome P450 [Pseudonocardiaceae bacterium]
MTAVHPDDTLLDVPRQSIREAARGIFAARRDMIGFLERGLNKHGDIFRMRLGGFPMIMVNHPDYVYRILTENHANYDKDNFMYRAIRPILRDGLIGNPGGESWRRRRRLMNPSFSRPAIAGFTEPMAEVAADILREWGAAADRGTLVDVSADASRLALRVVMRSLFGMGADPRVEAFERAFLEVNAIAGDFLRFPFPPLSWPTPAHNRLRRLVAELDAFVQDVVRSHAEHPRADASLFAALPAAVDDETGIGLTTEQLCHEILGVIIAGYETTSNALAWVMYQLATHADAQRRVQAEVAAVLGGRTPSFADLSRLEYTRRVVDETVRLCTPAWHTMRRAVAADVVGGYRIPRGSDIYLNMFTLHRHPRFWPDPERFDPDRFLPEAVAQRPKHVYQPFGTGPRHCLGKHFSLTELVLVTAMFAQSLTAVRPAGQPPVGFAPLVTLHPKGGIHLIMTRN